MSRFRWLIADWPVEIETLARRVRTRSFTELASDGFVVDRLRSDFCEGRYVERLQRVETVVDPFGNEQIYDRTEFSQVAFRATSGPPGLELVNPPRNVQSLLNRLSEVLDFRLVIEALSVDVLEWAERFRIAAELEFVIDSMQIGALGIEPGITGRMMIKGERDVREASSQLIQKRSHSLEKVQLRLKGSPKGTIVLTKVGTAKVTIDDEVDALLPSLRHSLVEARAFGTAARK